MTLTASNPRGSSHLEAFQPPAPRRLNVNGLFAGVPRFVVQTPHARNDYKKKAGSSDGAKTYDTTSV